MRLLLDTATFLWLTLDDPKLSDRARALFQNPANEVWLSAASAWEIAIKHSLGRLPLPAAPERFVPEQREAHGIMPLLFNEAAVLRLSSLPHHHRDPFDRILVCQAQADDLVILTSDEAIRAYPVKTDW
ncbi:type II toxin-antitoxin system VapC family toxin [Fontivita pretiosa]|uniref:type II toxin-antitoxin system VapC family toxin n=1 Tax=Fontivita pretiosa TaxID=2989684 RepID=UPI003D182FB1